MPKRSHTFVAARYTMSRAPLLEGMTVNSHTAAALFRSPDKYASARTQLHRFEMARRVVAIVIAVLLTEIRVELHDAIQRVDDAGQALRRMWRARRWQANS